MATPKARILVVDDEEGIRELLKDILKDILEEEGYLCLTAGSGLEALQFTDSEAVDLAPGGHDHAGDQRSDPLPTVEGALPRSSCGLHHPRLADVDLAVETSQGWRL